MTFLAMSLVAAYGTSDESGESDTEHEEKTVDIPTSYRKLTEGVTKSVENQNHVGNISDSDSDVENHSNQISEDKSFDKLLKDLPAPHSTSADIIAENDELEDEVKPKQSQMADLPKPPPKRGKQPVKITLPALEQDSDEEEPSKKKLRPTNTKGKSGLTSLLPPPVHAAKKEANRILLPYSLGRKPKTNPTNTKPKPSVDDKPTSPSYTQKKYSMFHGLTGYDSDSDEEEVENSQNSEPVNFFSLGFAKKSEKEEVTPLDSSSVKSKETESGIPTVSLPPPPSEQLPKNSVKGPDLSFSSNELNKPAQGPSLMPQIDQDAPLTFKGGQKSKASVPGVISSRQGVYGPVSGESGSGLVGELHEDQNMYYNMPYEQSSSYVEATDVKALEQDEEFLKLQGKPKRGKEEINILEVNTADFISTAEVTKSLSEEQEYRSHKKKDMPSAQQRRKHQIGFLAFQAKERELELKNQWATNRLTKKQTQAKYGF